MTMRRTGATMFCGQLFAMDSKKWQKRNLVAGKRKRNLGEKKNEFGGLYCDYVLLRCVF